MYLLYMCWVGE